MLNNLKKLSVRQKRFLKNIYNGMLAVPAYRKAYPQCKAADSTVSVKASTVRNHPLGVEYLQKLDDDGCYEAIKTKHELLEKLADILDDANSSNKDIISAIKEFANLAGLNSAKKLEIEATTIKIERV